MEIVFSSITIFPNCGTLITTVFIVILFYLPNNPDQCTIFTLLFEKACLSSEVFKKFKTFETQFSIVYSLSFAKEFSKKPLFL